MSLSIGILEKLIDGAVAIRSTNRVMSIFLYTLIIWIMYCLSTYFALLSTGVWIKWYEVCVLIISTTLSDLIFPVPIFLQL